MYIPPAFNEPNSDTLFEFIQQHSFGVLVSQHGDTPFATHLPFLTQRIAGESGHLLSHMARANPHWTFAEGRTVIAIFSGPHAYISPTWYETPNAVPTWNYTAVHVTGVFEAITDPNELMALLDRTVRHYESPREMPWQFETSNDFYTKLAQSVVGFRIRITTIEGKWKLSQNRAIQQQERVANVLAKSNDANERAVAETMRQKLAH